MDSLKRAELKKLLPTNTRLPELPSAKVPSGILSALPKEECYSILGKAAEEMLRLPSQDIDLEGLLSVLTLHAPTLDEGKIRRSTTTNPFVESLVETRKKMESVIKPNEGEMKYEEEVTGDCVEGHPDMWNKTQIFEVKCSGELNNPLKKSALWTSFLFQLFAYGSLRKEATDLYLVLPLQKEVIHYDIRKWEQRTAFRDFLSNWSKNEQTVGVENGLMASVLIHQCGIGCHTSKAKSLYETVLGIQDRTKPYQIFIGNPQQYSVNVKLEDCKKANDLIQQTKQQIFVHSPYLINLSTPESDPKGKLGLDCLCATLDGAKAAGFQGVVVHVGKSTTQPMNQAMQTMRANLLKAIEHASPSCPLLLETPAGQGTELLTGRDEFLDFVQSFNDQRLRVCIDTCHVFACRNPVDPDKNGHNPLDYIQEGLKRPGLVKLIHYNDSAEVCGACKDRHAFMGTGHIGLDEMRKIALLCQANHLPMVIE
jgi:deoxyribonuclease-4